MTLTYSISFFFLKDFERSRAEAMLKGPEGTTVRLTDPDSEEDISQYKFNKFAATYFQGGATPSFIKRPVKAPLLDLRNEGDRQVIWIKCTY